MVVLGPDEVHVWSAALRTGSTGGCLPGDLLSLDERVRAGRILPAQARDTFVLARSVLRTLAGAYLGLDPGLLCFEYTPLGRPLLAPTPAAKGLQFSVSHSAGRVLLAFSREILVGIDIERVRGTADCDAIAARFFGPTERSALAKITGRDRTEAFFACWTRKEAVLKAVGLGISRGLGQVEVTCLPGDPAHIVRSELSEVDPAGWSLWDLDAADGFRAAVAAGAVAARLRRLQIGIDDPQAIVAAT